MKGIQGLIVAAGLFVAAAILNYFYLHNEAQKRDMVYFIAVKADRAVNRGERFSADNLEPVGIPREQVGNLKEHAVLYSALNTVEGRTAWRTLPEGSLLLDEDYRTPPQELELGKNETVLWIPTDTRTFVPALVVPGDEVSFLVSAPTRATPALRPPRAEAADGSAAVPTPDASAAADPSPPAAATRTIGPFKVLSLGNRLGTAEVLRAARIAQVQENVMGIRVRVKQNGDLEDDAQQLWDQLTATNFRGVGVLLSNRKDTKK
jgi:hypothetical protein